MFRANDGQTAIQILKVKLTVAKFKCMEQSNMLNDEVINLFLELVKMQSDVYIFSTLFYAKLCESGKCRYKNVAKWTTNRRKNVDIFQRRMILFPINDSGNRWTLAAADVAEMTITYYDSLKGDGTHHMKNILKYDRREYKSKKKKVLNKAEWVLKNVSNVPVEENGVDCGVFMCIFALCIAFQYEPVFDQTDIPYMRSCIACSLLARKLIY